jgi:hypothetical protein
MPVTIPAQVERKRRIHKKSRKGCANCKLRGVKVGNARCACYGMLLMRDQCDELRPQCKKCMLYGVECGYGGAVTSLQLSSQSAFQVDFTLVGQAEQVVDMSSASLSVGEKANPGHDAGESYHPSFAGSYSLPSPRTPVSLNSSMASMINSSVQISLSSDDVSWDMPKAFWHFTDAHYEILFRYQHRTALTIGDKRISPAYRDCISHLAVSVSLNAFLAPSKADD